MFLKKFKKSNRVNMEENIIEPNAELDLDGIDGYRKVAIAREKDLGYKGLKKALEDKTLVRLQIVRNDEELDYVEGKISHYDENFNQLVIVSNNALKRFVFDQILEVEML